MTARGGKGETEMDRSAPTVILAVLAPVLLALLLYGGTLAPTLTLAHGGSDGAELAIAVERLGVPHPTGYPTYILLAQPLRLLPWRDLAGRLNLFSALAAALAVGCIALAAGERFRGLPAAIAALTAGVTLAVAGLFWSQAVIAEVYTLHCALLALLFWLLLRHRRTARPALLPLAGLFLGLGLGNHLSLLFFLPGAALFFFDRRPRRSEVLWAALLFLAGLGVYLYLPLRAAADPWLNWGRPADWPAFWAHVGGQAYRGYLFRVPWPQVAARLSATAGLLWHDMAPWGVLAGLAGLLFLARRDRPALALTAAPAGLGLFLALTYGGAESQVHLLPLYLAWALWAGLTAGRLTQMLQGRWRPRAALLLLLPPLLGGILAWRQWPAQDLHSDPGPLPTLTQTLEALPPSALLLTTSDETTFPAWYAQVVAGTRPDLAIVDVRLLQWPWYRQQLPRRYPDLLLPVTEEAPLPALLRLNAARPAFALEPMPLPPGYGLQATGAAYRIILP